MKVELDGAKFRLTMAAIVRAELASIEHWLDRGARLADIYDQCVAQGMVGSFRSFKKEIERARKRRRMKVGPNSDHTAPPVAGTGAAPPVIVSAAAVVKPPAADIAAPKAKTPGQEPEINLDQFFRRKSIFDRKGK